jgi:asparagine synthase (glutamine-hydrolysing)
MVSEVPLGTFLSGGIDSPAITYYAKKFKPDLKSFTIHFADKSFSEREEARLVASHLGTEHVDMEVSPDVEHLIPTLVDTFDEPFSDDSMIPSFYLNKLAREHMTVALSGDGGDELFGGYSTYLADQAAVAYRRIPGFLRRGVVEPLVNSLPVSFGRISWDYKLKAFVASAGRPSPLEHFGWTEVYTPAIKHELYSPEFLALTRGHDPAESYRQAYAEAGARGDMEKFLYVDQKTHLLDEFLVKVDRLSMVNSMEVRPPFLDHRLVEWALKIPFDLKIRRGVTKYILRRLFRDRLPAPIIGGPKKGFSPPISRWLAGELLPYARRKLSPEHLKAIPLLNPQAPGRLLEAHVARRANMGRKLWTILMFVEWYDRKVLKRA